MFWYAIGQLLKVAGIVLLVHLIDLKYGETHAFIFGGLCLWCWHHDEKVNAQIEREDRLAEREDRY